MTIRAQKYRNTYKFTILVRYHDSDGEFHEEVMYPREELTVVSSLRPRFFRLIEVSAYRKPAGFVNGHAGAEEVVLKDENYAKNM